MSMVRSIRLMRGERQLAFLKLSNSVKKNKKKSLHTPQLSEKHWLEVEDLGNSSYDERVQLTPE